MTRALRGSKRRRPGGELGTNRRGIARNVELESQPAASHLCAAEGRRHPPSAGPGQARTVHGSVVTAIAAPSMQNTRPVPPRVRSRPGSAQPVRPLSQAGDGTRQRRDRRRCAVAAKRAHYRSAFAASLRRGWQWPPSGGMDAVQPEQGTHQRTGQVTGDLIGRQTASAVTPAMLKASQRDATMAFVRVGRRRRDETALRKVAGLVIAPATVRRRLPSNTRARALGEPLRGGRERPRIAVQCRWGHIRRQKPDEVNPLSSSAVHTTP